MPIETLLNRVENFKEGKPSRMSGVRPEKIDVRYPPKGPGS